MTTTTNRTHPVETRVVEAVASASYTYHFRLHVVVDGEKKGFAGLFQTPTRAIWTAENGIDRKNPPTKQQLSALRQLVMTGLDHDTEAYVLFESSDNLDMVSPGNRISRICLNETSITINVKHKKHRDQVLRDASRAMVPIMCWGGMEVDFQKTEDDFDNLPVDAFPLD